MVTHVWLSSNPEIPALARQPGRIAAGDEWETWIEQAQVATIAPNGIADFVPIACVRISGDHVFGAEQRHGVPPGGYIPG